MLNGIDRIHEFRNLFAGKRIGLITSISGVNNKLTSTIEILHRNFELKVLFSPEHGVRGDKDAGERVDYYIDEITGIPVYSLYRKDSKRFTKEMLDSFDVLVYDIQDVGVRYYTFISTLVYAIEDCGKAGKELIVLDRANPLGGRIVEGNVLNPNYTSFIGACTIPTRYGLTIGELAKMVNEEKNLRCDLKVVPCLNWNRDTMFPDTNRIWVMPSLGIPRFETALLYPGTCLIEGTNLSEGRGTSCPFEIIGAPYIKAPELVEVLKGKKLEGVAFTPAYFKPTASKYKDIFCQGVHIHITNRNTYQSYRTGLTLMEAIRDTYPDKFEFLNPIKEGSRPLISLLSGNAVFEKENWSCESILEENKKELDGFIIRKEKYHMYQ